jgi:hypothetical protein
MSNAYAQFTGLTPTNFPTNTRTVGDANFATTVALPNAASTTVYSTSFDLGDPIEGTNFPTPETINLAVVGPALSTTILPDTKTMTYTVQDSADNSSFAAIGTLAAQVQTGAGGAGAAAIAPIFKLPPNTRRYIRLSVASGANTTDASALSASFALLF